MGCRRTQNGWKHGKPSFAKALCYCTPLHVWVSRPPDGHLVDQDKHSYQYCRSIIRCHSSEIRGLCMMKWPCEMLQNLPYFWKMKTQIFFHLKQFWICNIMDALIYVNKHKPLISPMLSYWLPTKKNNRQQKFEKYIVPKFCLKILKWSLPTKIRIDPPLLLQRLEFGQEF